MLVVAKYECAECGDIFEATSENYGSCKCGKNYVQPSLYLNSYRTNDGRGNYFKRLETKEFYTEDDFFIFDNELMSLWEQIKSFKFEGGKYYDKLFINEIFAKSDDGKEFLSNILAYKENMNKYNELNKVQFKINLSKKHRRFDRELIFQRLTEFLQLLNDLKDKTIDINDRTKLKEICGDFSKEQQDLYDYTFYF